MRSALWEKGGDGGGREREEWRKVNKGQEKRII